jgi:four helix bundle suffix protein
MSERDQADCLLGRQLQTLEQQFLKRGGVSERLSQARRQARAEYPRVFLVRVVADGADSRSSWPNWRARLPSTQVLTKPCRASMI